MAVRYPTPWEAPAFARAFPPGFQMDTTVDSPPRIHPTLGLALGIMAASTAAIFIRYAQAEAPSFVIAAYRLGLATLLMAPWAIYRRSGELRRLHGGQLGLALLSGLFLALHFAAWISSLEFTSVASSVVLVSTTPLWVALLSPWVLKEPLARLVLGGMLLAFSGGLVIGLNDACQWVGGSGLVCPPWDELLAGRAVWGNLLAVLGAWMAAAYLLIGRSLRHQVSLLSYVFVVYGMAALVLLGLVLLARQPLVGYPPRTYLWFLLLALVPQLLGHSSFNWALRYVSAAYVSIALLGEPIGSAILAAIFLNGSPTGLKIFGAILILIGIYLASRAET